MLIRQSCLIMNDLQDLFSSLCDMFGMSETKIVDDDLFIRFGLAVQLLLHATAMARRARSNSKAAGSGFSTPGGHGATTPGRTPGILLIAHSVAASSHAVAQDL